jgi:hypothetical protein
MPFVDRFERSMVYFSRNAFAIERTNSIAVCHVAFYRDRSTMSGVSSVRRWVQKVSLFDGTGISGRHVTIDSGPDKPGNAAMSDEDLKAELERLRSENATLKKGASTSIRMKVSEKGAVSIYGMGRFPVTLYKEQWLKLLDMSDDIRAFIAANEGQLKKKD